jgi:molybdenum cofactor cytidylyltransferase
VSAPAAIVLAAGEGRRMGGPKALLVVDGKALVCAHVQRLREVACRPIVVVVRAVMVEYVRALLGAAPDAEIVSSDTSSMAGSLTVGLRWLGPGAGQAIVVATVDSLPVRPSTLFALQHALLAHDVNVATPSYRGRGGHPVVARADLLQVFLRGYAGTLRDLIHASAAQRVRIEVDDPAVVGGLDTPADLRAVRPGLVPCFAHLSPDTGITAKPSEYPGRSALGPETHWSERQRSEREAMRSGSFEEPDSSTPFEGRSPRA